MEFYYITNNIEIAKICDKNNVIPWIDLEKLGKEVRQKGMNTVKSNHSISDIKNIKKVLHSMPLLVRINPINKDSENEINQVINAGADIIMLPFFHNKNEVEKFIKFVAGRCKTMLLFETKDSVHNIDSVLGINGIDKVHIGLNDLHLSYRLNFMFELISNGIIDYICEKFRQHGFKNYGFGGIAKLGHGNIPAEYIISEHVRLKSNQAILSRSFCNFKDYEFIEDFEKDFVTELEKIKLFYSAVSLCNKLYVETNHITTNNLINNINIQK
ncbi:aldolase/citrate lyase family protein [uncultured Thomasclavelia sp.]|uniref:aldolase/citrate lyase family protein n=1 Tax=uncultured Thomasclavelia sp. TaxID=3025759 RepID=UPI00262C6294|nr:aldolase/citrate lyase family protein [uncultured Thomasclavelia sp.]